MKPIALAIASSLLAIGVSIPAIASEYGSSRLAFGASVTWILFDDRSSNPIGYVCVSQDALLGMPRRAYARRYAINMTEGSRGLQPLRAVDVMNEGGGQFVASEANFPDLSELWQNVELDASQEWFANNDTVSPLGRACVDGGISGFIQHLEGVHRTDITEP